MYTPGGQPPRFALLPSNLRPRCPAARHRSQSRVNEHACEERHVEASPMSASESKGKPEHVYATCRRRHARGRILTTLDSLSSLSLSLLFFFFYTRDFTCLSRFHPSTKSYGPPYFYSRRIATSDRSDLFSFSIQDYATIVKERSSCKRRRVQHLPSVMQLAFNPHSRILELNSTVCHETGSCTDVVIARIPEFIISL